MQVAASVIFDIAATMVGIPYKHLGRDPKVGLDCWGLVIEFFRRMGLFIKDPIGFYREDWWKHDDLFLEFAPECFVKVIDPSPGAVVSMCVNSHIPNHLAVLVKPGFILNTDRCVGVHLIRIIKHIQHKITDYHCHRDLIVI